MREAREAGTTVFLSSHILSEVEHVCDRVGIVREGNLVTVGTLAELIGVRARRIEIALEGDPALARLRSVPGLDRLDVIGHLVTAMLRGGLEHPLAEIAGQLVV